MLWSVVSIRKENLLTFLFNAMLANRKKLSFITTQLAKKFLNKILN